MDFIKKINFKILGFAILLTTAITLPILTLVGSVLLTELPSLLIPYTEVTHKYNEDVLWAEDRLLAMGLTCPKKPKIKIYQSFGFLLENKVEGYVKEDTSISIIIGNKVSYDEVALNLIKALGHNCSNEKGKNGENSVFSRSLSNEENVLHIKKFGMLQYCKKDSCSYKTRTSLNDKGSDSFFHKNNLLKSFIVKPEVLPYSYIKTDLNLYIDAHETKLALDQEPLSFSHNFNKTSKYPLIFQTTKK